MNRPLTDRERLWALEAENASLREELAAYKANERSEGTADAYLRREVAIRKFLGISRLPNARGMGAGPAAILLHLIDRAGVPVHRETLYGLRADREGDSRVIDVQVCSLRRVLERSGYAGAIESVRGRGYMVGCAAAQKLRREVLGEP